MMANSPEQHGDGRERADRPGRAPARLLGGDDRVDEQQHRGGDGQRTGQVEPAPGRVDPLAAGDEPDGRGQHDQRDRGGHQQRPPPADLGEQAGQHEPQREPAGAEDRVDAERAVPHRSLGERGGEQGHAGRRGERGRRSLDEPGRYQQAGAAHQAAEDGDEGEDGQRHQKDPPASEQVSGPAAEQQQAAVAEHVAADDPLQRRRAQAEGGPDGRQGDADHRDIQAVEAQRAAEHEQDGPQLRRPAPAVRVTSIGVKCIG